MSKHEKKESAGSALAYLRWGDKSERAGLIQELSGLVPKIFQPMILGASIEYLKRLLEYYRTHPNKSDEL